MRRNYLFSESLASRLSSLASAKKISRDKLIKLIYSGVDILCGIFNYLYVKEGWNAKIIY